MRQPCLPGTLTYELQLHLNSEVDPVEQICYGTCIECSCNPMKAVFTFDCDFCCGNLTVTVEEVENSGGGRSTDDYLSGILTPLHPHS